MNNAIYTISDLESLTDVPRRKIRYWISLKLVPQSYPPLYPGEWQLPRYGEEHRKRIEKLKLWYEYKVNDKNLAERLELVGEKALEIPDIYDDE